MLTSLINIWLCRRLQQLLHLSTRGELDLYIAWRIYGGTVTIRWSRCIDAMRKSPIVKLLFYYQCSTRRVGLRRSSTTHRSRSSATDDRIIYETDATMPVSIQKRQSIAIWGSILKRPSLKHLFNRPEYAVANVEKRRRTRPLRTKQFLRHI